MIKFCFISGRKSAIMSLCHCGSVSEGNGDLRRGQTLAMVSPTYLCANSAGGQSEGGGIASDKIIDVIVVSSIGQENGLASTVAASTDRFIEKEIVFAGTLAEFYGFFDVLL